MREGEDDHVMMIIATVMVMQNSRCEYIMVVDDDGCDLA